MGQDNSSNPIASGLEAFGKTSYYGDDATKQQQENIDAAEAGLKALEDRYAQPNWFKVAAGFAKPQLGGFVASLGSASNALGDWQEQQRANEIPIYNARAQLGYMQSQQAHRRSAEKLFRQGATNGFTNSMVTEIMGHDDKELGPKALELYKQQQENLRGGNEAAVSAGRVATEMTPSIAGQVIKNIRSPNEPAGLGLSLPVNQPSAPIVGGTDYSLTGNTPAPAATPSAAATNAPLINLPVGAGGVSAKEDQAIREAQVKKTNDFVNDLGARLPNVQQRAANLISLYDLTNHPGVQQVLGRDTNGSVESAIRNSLNSTSLPDIISAQARLLVSPELEKKYPGTADKVQQLLRAHAEELLAVNNSTLHPTVSMQHNEQNAAFSLTDTPESTRKGVLSKLHILKKPFDQYDVYRDLATNGADFRNVPNDPRLKDIDQEWQRRHDYLQNRPSDSVVPKDLTGTSFTVRPWKDVIGEIEARNKKRQSIAEQIKANAQKGTQ